MNYKSILIILLSVFFSCGKPEKKSDVSLNSNLRILLNADTFYIGEEAKIKIFLEKDGLTSLTKPELYFEKYKLVYGKDTARVTFTPSISETPSNELMINVAAVITTDKGKDTLKNRRNIWVSKELLNKRNAGLLKDTTRLGKWTYWYDNEKRFIRKIEHYDFQGKKTGTDSLFYEPWSDNTNTLKSIYEFKNGWKNGRYVEYYESGKLMIEGNYIDDLQDGYFKTYGTSGKLFQKEFYKNGELK